MTRNVQGSPNRTVVIIDGENMRDSLKRIGLRLNNLKTFVSNFLGDNDVLTPFKNREGDLINPVVYIINLNPNRNKIAREKQIAQLRETKFRNRNLVRVIAVESKVSAGGRISSCTDSAIATIIGAALYSESVDKIIVVSGDGDFLLPLELIGIAEKEIDMVGIRGAVSGKLMAFVRVHEGRVMIIENKIPGIVETEKPIQQKESRQDMRYRSRCLKQEWNDRK